ncbi:MAG: molybdenum cofactor guanylyltransferase MobA [Geminicoccaceae bacterium]
MSGITGLLLAGGQARRMGGGDKCLRPLGGRPLLAHVIERARPQVNALVLNANGDADRFASFGLPVVADSVPDFAGPLAGILAGLDWAARCRPSDAWVLSIATDTPFFPRDLAAALLDATIAQNASLACAASGGRAHPVFGLWPAALREELRDAVRREGLRKIDLWTARYPLAIVEFPAGPVDPFFNANRPEDLTQAERLLDRA